MLFFLEKSVPTSYDLVKLWDLAFMTCWSFSQWIPFLKNINKLTCKKLNVYIKSLLKVSIVLLPISSKVNLWFTSHLLPHACRLVSLKDRSTEFASEGCLIFVLCHNGFTVKDLITTLVFLLKVSIISVPFNNNNNLKNKLLLNIMQTFKTWISLFLFPLCIISLFSLG